MTGTLLSDSYGLRRNIFHIIKFSKSAQESQNYPNGTIYCKPNTNELHRLDGPAWKNAYCEQYYVNDKLHRLDGPAVTNTLGSAWYVEGKRIKVVLVDGTTTLFENDTIKK